MLARWTRPWSQILATNLGGAAAVAMIIHFAGNTRPLSITFLLAVVYAMAIGTPASLVMPRLGRHLAHRDGSVLRLILMTLALVVIAVVGALVATLSLIAIGAFTQRAYRVHLIAGLGIAVPVTLLFGSIFYFHELGRRRDAEAQQTLRETNERRERSERLATEARLASLESRLHPHFLFNTLNAITNLVTEDPQRAEQLLAQLADLLRASLRPTSHTVPLRDELAIVGACLDLEKARLENRLRCSVNVPAHLGDCEVPPFSLHALVQNCVKHVAAVRPEGATIRIDGHRAGDQLILAVWDDGPGFALNTVPVGHGIDTLRSQLCTIFGDRARLWAQREENGMRVIMAVPMSCSVSPKR